MKVYFRILMNRTKLVDLVLTLPEQRYVIDILHRCGYCVDIDCESGCIYIVSSPDIG